MNISKTLAATVMMAFAATAAAAQDFWDSPYAGIYGGGWSGNGDTGQQVGAQIGFNRSNGASGDGVETVWGGEFQYGAYTFNGSSFDWTEYYLLGRMGVLVNPQTLLFGFAGFGDDDGDPAYLIGAGVERQLDDRTSAFIKLGRGDYTSGGSSPWNTVAVGFNIRFGGNL